MKIDVHKTLALHAWVIVYGSSYYRRKEGSLCRPHQHISTRDVVICIVIVIEITTAIDPENILSLSRSFFFFLYGNVHICTTSNDASIRQSIQHYIHFAARLALFLFFFFFFLIIVIFFVPSCPSRTKRCYFVYCLFRDRSTPRVVICSPEARIKRLLLLGVDNRVAKARP